MEDEEIRATAFYIEKTDKLKDPELGFLSWLTNHFCKEDINFDEKGREENERRLVFIVKGRCLHAYNLICKNLTRK